MSNVGQVKTKKTPGISDGGVNSWVTTEEKHLDNYLPDNSKIVYTPRIAGTRDLCADARTLD